jgi:hypothetical protein
MSLYKQGWVGLFLLCSGSAYAVQEATERTAQQPLDKRVIKLETTIRGSREQPKVMSIVPWQPPSQKQVLPSPILQRIEQKFKPLKRDEFQRQIQFFDNTNPPK